MSLSSEIILIFSLSGLLAFVGGYMLGSAPFGLLLSKVFGYGDIRNIGSGNIGATNVLRTGNPILALVTLILDGGKGAMAVGLTILALSESSPLSIPCLLAGIAAVLGHNFPIWLRFKGGKGVATTIGLYFVAYWPLGVFVCFSWAVIAGISRISSLSALVSMALAPIFIAFYPFPFLPLDAADRPKLLAFTILLGGLCWLRHRDNIRRLMKGQETRIGQQTKK